MSIYDIINICCALVSVSVAISFILYKIMSRNKEMVKTTKGEILDFDPPVSVFHPAGNVVAYSLHQQDQKEIPFCWAMVSGYEDSPSEAVLWMIYTREKYRGQGYAKKLISFLQIKYETILTQYEHGIVNSAGVKLCMSCGFVMKPSIHKRHPSQLIWKKGK